MGVELLVSTMDQKDHNLIERMHIRSDAVIVNQCAYDKVSEIITTNNNRIIFISNKDRGLSRSRNVALSNAKGNICVLADDDMVYVSGYSQIITQQYGRYSDADIIAFRVLKSDNSLFKQYCPIAKGLSYISCMKVSSVEITFKRESVVNSGLRFDELFGAGSRYYVGEENIFLSHCLQMGLKVYYVPIVIGKLLERQSTWFKGYDQKYFISRGAAFYAMSQGLSWLLIMQFAIRKYSLYKSFMSFIRALWYMFKGMKEYKSILNSKKVII